jgi:lactate dehydrogenase-like 2-hydroxyacid dehydrogenase
MILSETRNAPFPTLLLAPPLPVIADGLGAALTLHKLYEAADPEAELARIAPAIRAVVSGAGFPKVDAALMQRLPNLTLVSNYGVGYDTVDVAYAREHGIIVTHTPDVLTDEVADLAIGLLIATVRRIPQADRYLRAGKWEARPFPFSSSLREKTMGILGLGRIGLAIAKRAEAFGLRLAYHSRSPKAEAPWRYYASLVEMARDVDILMVIAPGGPETFHIVNTEVLHALGASGTLINVARGTLVDESALTTALETGTLGAAGLDVFEDEPRVSENLRRLDNCVLLPHVGSASHYTRNKMGQLVVDNVLAIAAGRAPLTPVPETPFTP